MPTNAWTIYAHVPTCRWLLAAVAMAGGAAVVTETQGAPPARESLCCDDHEREDADSDPAPRRNQAVELFEEFLFDGVQENRAKLEATQLDALRHKIDAIDLICRLTVEQKERIQLAGQGDIQHLLEQIDQRTAELLAIDDEDVPGQRDEIASAAISLQKLGEGLFRNGSLFDKTLARGLTKEQAAQFEPFRNVRWLRQAFDVQPRLDGGHEMIGIRLTGVPVCDEHLESLGKYVALQTLSLSGTKVTDAGLVHLSALSRLEQLELAGTGIHGRGLVHLKTLPNLKGINLNGTHVTGAELECLATLPRLRELRLADAPVTDTGLESLKGFERLEILSLRGARITDAGLASIAELVALRQLDLDGTAIGDAGLMQLASLRNLRMLDLRKTRVTDAGLDHLAGLKNLKYLCLFDTQVTSAAVARLKQSLPELRADR